MANRFLVIAQTYQHRGAFEVEFDRSDFYNLFTSREALIWDELKKIRNMTSEKPYYPVYIYSMLYYDSLEERPDVSFDGRDNLEDFDLEIIDSMLDFGDALVNNLNIMQSSLLRIFKS